MRPILSVRDLASRLGVRDERLYEVAAELTSDMMSHYSQFSKFSKKNKSKIRELTVPDRELKDIQQRIKNHVLGPIRLTDSAHGGVRGRSTHSNASKHLDQRCVINIDVRDFFPSISPTVVCKMFRQGLGFGRDVASLLTKLTTADCELPQGAPTSTSIANLVLTAVDVPISEAAEAIGVRYTRYVDDITFSGDDPRPLINILAQLLSSKGLSIHRKKTKWLKKAKLKITHAGKPQEVTGLIVNSRAGPSVNRQYRSDVRRAIFNLSKISETSTLEKSVRSIRGKISYIQQSNPGSAKRLQAYLEARVYAT